LERRLAPAHHSSQHLSSQHLSGTVLKAGFCNKTVRSLTASNMPAPLFCCRFSKSKSSSSWLRSWSSEVVRGACVRQGRAQPWPRAARAAHAARAAYVPLEERWQRRRRRPATVSTGCWARSGDSGLLACDCDCNCCERTGGSCSCCPGAGKKLFCMRNNAGQLM
jgi:hypothetical protein